ncbi:DUF4386 domain-containing protein [Kribbella sp. NBC_00482]|uniref:DUF4386 domain-containing protein n=1 Tax=Kribbella sp. NBC_00482 TaxID=2975968 RepID=UPI002E19B6DD
MLALLILIPLADQADRGQLGPDAAQAPGSLAVDANETAYQIGQLSLAFGALFLCALLLRTRLAPKWLAVWGLVGYALHLVGAGAELWCPQQPGAPHPRRHLRGHVGDLAPDQGVHAGGVRPITSDPRPTSEQASGDFRSALRRSWQGLVARLVAPEVQR